MREAEGRLRAQLLGLAHHVRDPASHAPPPDIEDRRLRVYRELFLGSIEGLLASSFPVIHRTLGDEGWRQLVRAFYTGHRCTTPLFAGVAGEFVAWLAARDPAEASGDPPWLAELAHYEWVEVDLQLQDVAADVPPGQVRLSSLARPLAYCWPVHRIGPAWRPDAPPAAPTLLLARRDDAGDVRFSELSPLVFRLLQLLDGEGTPPSPRAALEALAAEAGRPGDTAFHADGEAMLRRLLAEGTLVRGG